MTDARLKFKKMAVKAARLADSKKAEEIAVYDLAGRSTLADFAVAATVDSPAHLEAVNDEISIKLKQDGSYPVYRDGARSRNWKVLDYGGLIVHIVERQARDHYSLDALFENAKKIKWEPPAPAPETPARRASPAAKRRKPPPARKKLKKPAYKKAAGRTTRSASLRKSAAATGKSKRPAAKKSRAEERK